MTAGAKKLCLRARTVAATRQETRTLLQKSGQSDNCDYLLCHALGKSRTWLYTNPEKHLDDSEKNRIEYALESCLAGIPIAYLRREKEFFSLCLKVTPDTLIPRPETELLVEYALRCEKSGLRVLDLGTGCGNIALAIQSQRPYWSITASDISPAALKVAQHNANRHRLTRIRFIQSDWFASLHGLFDLIIGNPPYLAKDDPDISPQVAQHEPPAALFARENGLACLGEIIETAKNFLKPDAQLIIEHGYRQADAVHEMAIEAGFKSYEKLSDNAGHPRAACLRPITRPSDL